MESYKERLLQQAYEDYIDLIWNDFPLERAEELVASDVSGYGTTLDEKVLDIARLKKIVIDQREQAAGMNIQYVAFPVHRRISQSEDNAIFVDEFEITLDNQGNQIIIPLRLSSVFEFIENGWKLVHIHGSKAVETEGDTWHIEEWKQKNEKLQNLVDERTAELKKSLENLKAAQAQLIHAEKMASLGELTAGIAHEIQNPLNFVNNFSEVSVELLEEMEEDLQNGKLDGAISLGGEIRQNLEKISHHGHRASSIVKGMLEHSRSSNGQKEKVDIKVLADEYLRLAYHGLRAKDKSFQANFKLEADEDLPNINVIPQDMGRVLLNLINNAFYAVSSKIKTTIEQDYKPEVIIKINKVKNAFEIRIRDNGDGIPEEVMEKIFQPFFTTKPTGEGTGLGLSLSYDIITKGHGGELKVETQQGTGTEFIIVIPE